MTAKEILEIEYGDSHNFMTPTRLEVGMATETMAYELSTGSGINHEPIFGVSLVQYSPLTNATTRMTKLSECFQSRKAAKGYIESLRL